MRLHRQGHCKIVDSDGGLRRRYHCILSGFERGAGKGLAIVGGKYKGIGFLSLRHFHGKEGGLCGE